jgi:hypothetical protein
LPIENAEVLLTALNRESTSGQNEPSPFPAKGSFANGHGSFPNNLHKSGTNGQLAPRRPGTLRPGSGCFSTRLLGMKESTSFCEQKEAKKL